MTFKKACKEFEEFIGMDGTGLQNISVAEKKLFTTYRKQFIAWLRLQQ